MLPRRFLKLFGFESRLNQRDRLPRRTRPQLEQLEDRTLLSGSIHVTSISGSPNPVTAGDDITYHITVNNFGPGAALSVDLTDPLPTGETYLSQSQTSGPAFTLAQSGNGISDTISSLAAGASAQFAVVALVSPSQTSSLSDTATATATGNTPNSDSTTTSVSTQADLVLSAVAQPAVLVGNDIAYTVTITNDGPSDAQNVGVTNNLPSGLTFASQSQTGGSAFTLGNTGNDIDDTISTLPAGASATLNFLASVNTGVSNGTLFSNTVNDSSSTTNTGSSTAVVDTTAYTSGPVSITNPGTQSSTEGASVSLSISASDATGGTLSYAASGLPAGLAINASTGAITGTVAVGDAASSPYRVTVTAGDGTYTADATFTWNISSPVSITNPGDQTNSEGDTVSLSISASDSSSGTLVFGATGLPAGLKISTSTGAITGTVGIGDAATGPYSVTVTANDGTYSASTSFTWNINSPVTMAPVADQTSTEGDTVSLSISASDSTPGATLVYGASGLPPGLAISTSSGAITGTVAPGDADCSPYSVTVSANDGTSSASQSFTWTVNSPIAITTPADQTNNEGDTVSLSISASDSSAGTLSYGAVGLPAGLSINAATGAITGTVSNGAAADGPYTVTLLAGDGTYRNTTAFTWNVSSPITITQPSDQTNKQGDSVSLSISASYSGGSLAYAASGLPNGLSINSSTGVISGTISAGGFFTPTVTATYNSISASVTLNWTVSSTITIIDPGPQAYNAGDAVSLPISASDTATGTLSYSASSLPTGLSINSSSGMISGTISSSLSAGVYTSTVSVTDGTNTAVDSFACTISPSTDLKVTNPGAQSTTEGNSVSLSIGTSYSGSGTVSYAADNLPPGLKINPSTGAITGTVAAGDSLLAPYAVTVTATDGTATDSQYFTWNVASPITLTNPGTQSSTEGGSVSLSISASYTGGALTYSASGLPGGLTINASTGAITGTVAVDDAASGPYSVTVQAASGAYAAEQTFTWNIASPITITTPAAQTNNEGDTVSLSISASDSSSGTLSYAAQGLPTGLAINTSSGTISGTVALGTAAGEPYDVTLTASDGTYSSSVDFTWTVSSPIMITTPADQTSTEGASASLSISASDSVSGATLSYAATGLPPGLKINPTTGAITGTVSVGDAANGPYSVTVAAEDGTYNAETTFAWNVNSPITITVPADQTNNQGDTVSLAISVSNSAGGTLAYSASGLPSGLSINSSSGVISGTLSDGGFWAATVTVTNGTYSATSTFGWTVNSVVSITDPGDQLNMIGDTVSLQISASDSASGTLSYSASGLPTGLSINSSTGVISGAVGGGASTSTPYSTTITVSDGTNAAVDTFTWTINPAGPVSIAHIADQTNTADDEVVLSVSVSDTAGGTLIFNAVGLPAGLYINPDTGLIFGTIAAGAASGTAHSVTVTASDGSHTASQTFNWSVSTAGTVTLANPGDQTNNEGDTASVSLSAADSSSGTLSYAAFGLPAGLKINPSTGAITGTVAVGDALNGPYSVTVTANDGTYSASQTFAWNVNSPITITQPADATNNEGDTASLTISASDSISGSTLSYAALGLPPGLDINTSTGAITGTVAVGDAADGPYTVTVVASDGTYSASATFAWSINSPITIATPFTQTNNDGDTVSLTIGATDSHSGTLTFSIQGLPPGLSMNPSTAAISGTIARGDSTSGSFFPQVVVTDGTYTAVSSFEWDVSGAIAIADPGSQANTVGDTVTLQISATDSSSGTLSYAVAGLPAGLAINPTTGLISGTIASAASSIGAYTTTVTVSDGTNTASDVFDWTVSAAGTVTLATPANQTNHEGDSVSLMLSASDSGSGTLHYFAVGLPTGLKINASTGAITGTVAIGDSEYGPYTITAIATDGTYFAEESFTWTITGPVTITTPANQTNNEGDTVSLTISASDSSSGTLSFSAVGLPAGLKISKSTGAITGTVGLDAAAYGPYTVMVTASDGTYSASTAFSWTVNSPVTITGVAAQKNYEGDTPTLTISASDSSGGTLRYMAAGLPRGLYINPDTGAIGGMIAAGAAAGGPYTVLITAQDGTYSASTNFTWNVNNPITITDPGEQYHNEGDNVDLLLHVSDAHSGTLSYEAYGLPPGLTIDAMTGEISGTIEAGAADTGSFDSIITVTDQTYTNTLVIQWTVFAPGSYYSEYAADDTVFTILERNFKDWANGQQGITEDQIKNNLIGDSTIKEQDAAALAVLAGSLPGLTQYFKVSAKVGVTLQEIQDADKASTGFPDAAGLFAQSMQTGYLGRLKQIQDRPTTVITGQDGPKFIINNADAPGAADALHQGAAGDCVLMSSVISMLHLQLRPPKGAKSPLPGPGIFIEKKGDSSYVVGFPAGTNVTVPAPTDAQVALYSRANGLWSILVEEAFAKEIALPGYWWNPVIFWNGAPQNEFTLLTGKVVGDVTQLLTRKGQYEFTLLTGKVVGDVTQLLTRKGQSLYFTNGPLGGGVFKTSPATIAAALSAVTNTTVQADANGCFPLTAVVVAGSNENKAWTPDQTKLLPPGHAYAVIGYDPNTKIIEFQNPWGNPAYTFGMIFTMKLDDFMKQFYAISVGASLG